MIIMHDHHTWLQLGAWGTGAYTMGAGGTGYASENIKKRLCIGKYKKNNHDASENKYTKIISSRYIDNI